MILNRQKMDILLEGLNFPEGPAFDSQGGLWCVELHGGNLVRYADGNSERIATGGKPNGMCFDHLGRIWFCDAEKNAIRTYHPLTGAWSNIIDCYQGTALGNPNDLAFDPYGNLVFTCPGDSRQKSTGRVYCLTATRELLKIRNEMYFPNGVCFYGSDNKLLVTESYRQALWQGGWDPHTCTWENAGRWVDLGGSPGPDGMAVGKGGLIYTAVYGTGAIKVSDKDGKIVAEIDLPGMNPTNCAFDPLNRYGLVVTEAERGLLISFPELGPGRTLWNGKII